MNIEFSYVFCIVIVAAGGIPKGYDEGGFSASISLPSFTDDYGLSKSLWKEDPAGLASRTANINGFGVLGAAIGALLSLLLNDRFGRLRCWRGYFLLWASGIIIQTFASGNLGLLLFARIWGGLGAGALTVISPIFLTEIAHTRIRGLIVSIFMVFLLTFLSVGFFVNYGAAQNLPATRLQYRMTQVVPLIPCGLAFIASFFFVSESPRWLAAQDRPEEALTALSFLGGSSTDEGAIRKEIEEIQHQLATRHQTLRGVTTATAVKEIATVPSYRRRFFLAAAMQTVAQWSGGNGIYTPASDVAILSVFIYAVGWSIGLCTVQYIYGTEIFPTRHMNVCYATFTGLPWFSQFAVVYATPSMLVALNVWGGFLFWALVCAIGIVLLGVMAPETKRVPIEGMDELFAGPWYKTWKATCTGIPHYEGRKKDGGERA